ncbi:hypothetical protein M153_10002129 [Pseudoloma neurophilia]|uniref:Uncharacterized protein n=1 Tax=Pseudoloma neurophilia TaxID=146866 RepID=A0A0R0M178_9MICR|nr:hypothetical protein M153_10002129 [Pseudoloma neurophilia]
MLFFYLAIILTAENPNTSQNISLDQVENSMRQLKDQIKEKSLVFENLKKDLKDMILKDIQNGEMQDFQEDEVKQMDKKLDDFDKTLKSMKAHVHQLAQNLDIVERENSASEEQSNSESEQE